MSGPLDDMEKYIGLARWVVEKRRFGRSRNSSEYQNMLDLAMDALVAALCEFKPGLGCTKVTFVTKRIHWALSDKWAEEKRHQRPAQRYARDRMSWKRPEEERYLAASEAREELGFYGSRLSRRQRQQFFQTSRGISQTVQAEETGCSRQAVSQRHVKIIEKIHKLNDERDVA